MGQTKKKQRKRKKIKFKTLYRVARRALLYSDESPKKRAQSVALAAFMAFIPLYGLQTIVGILLAFVLRLNKILVAVLINIITPYPLVPLIIFLSFKAGGWFVAQPTKLGANQSVSLQFLQDNFLQYLAGGTFLAVLMGTVLGFLSYPLFVFLNKKKQNKIAAQALK